MHLIRVDLPGTRWAAYNDTLAFVHGEIDVLEHVKFSEPLVHLDNSDNGLGRYFVRGFRCLVSHFIVFRLPRGSLRLIKRLPLRSLILSRGGG